MKVNVPHYEVNVPHYEVNVPHYEAKTPKYKQPKIYHIKKSEYVTLLLILAIVAAIAAELLTLFSSRASSTYSISSLDNIMLMSDIAVGLLIAIFILSIYLKGRVSMFLLDAMRYAAVVLMCVCFYLVLEERATLMGYVWFSDLESGSASSVRALNLGVIAAAMYAASVILCAVSCGFEFVSAKKVKRTPEVIKAEIAALQQELAALTGETVKQEDEHKEEKQEINSGRSYNIDGNIIASDDFLKKLSNAERKEFYYMFIGKEHGTFNGVPEYKAGGNNRQFFIAVVARIDKFRPMLSYELMEKIKQEYLMNRKK